MGNGGLKKWVKRLKKGDQSAFLPLYEKTAPGLMRFLLWKTNGDRPLAEDIMQETFVKFLVNLDNIEGARDIAVHSYLLRVAKNCLIDKVGRGPYARHVHISTEKLGELPASAQMSSAENAVELRELAIAMDALDEKESEIIWLRDAMGYSHQEVAKQVGITEQASRQAYVRAKRNLLAELADRWFPVGSGGRYATSELS